MKLSIKDFSSKCDQIRSKLQIWSHLLKKFYNGKFYFLCSDTVTTIQIRSFVSNLLLQLKFEARFLNQILIPKSTTCFRKRRFGSGNKASNLICNNKLETKLWIWIFIIFWTQNFDSEKEASIPETQLWFWNQSFFSEIEVLFSNCFSNLNLKLRFQNWSFVSWIKDSFPKLKLLFWNRSFVSNLLKQFIFEA